MKKEIVVPVMVECTFNNKPMSVNLANVAYVHYIGESMSVAGVYFTNGDSHVIDQSPREFEALAEAALTAAGVTA